MGSSDRGVKHIYNAKINQNYKTRPKCSKFPENWKHSNWKTMTNLLINGESDEKGLKVNE